MKASEINEGIGVMVDAMACVPNVNKILLFGSRARGDHVNDRVDVDIAVSGPELTDHQWRLITGLVEAAPTLIKIDCVHLEKQSGAFLDNILHDGVILYESGKNTA